MTKGLVNEVVYTVIGVVFAIIILTFLQTVLNVPEVFMRESVHLSGDRVETGVYGLSALENAKLEITFNASRGMNFTRKRGNKYISYTYAGETERSRLRNPYGINYYLKVAEKTKAFDKICLVKKEGGVVIKGGECEWKMP